MLGASVMSGYLRLRVGQQQRKARIAKPKKTMSGNVSKSLRRHGKLNHNAVGGYGHMGRRSSKPKAPCPREDQIPPMRVALSDFVRATSNGNATP